jgi:hypothetical protein
VPVYCQFTVSFTGNQGEKARQSHKAENACVTGIIPTHTACNISFDHHLLDGQLACFTMMEATDEQKQPPQIYN